MASVRTTALNETGQPMPEPSQLQIRNTSTSCHVSTRKYQTHPEVPRYALTVCRAVKGSEYALHMINQLKEILTRVTAPLGVLACIILSMFVAAHIETQLPSKAQDTADLDRSWVTPNWPPLPAADAAIQSLAFGSCLQQSRPAPIFKSIITEKPNLILMMGDNVYGDVKSAGLDELRIAYDQLRHHPDFSPAAAGIPMLATWDDHDYGLNDGGADFAHRIASARLFRAFWKRSGGTHLHASEGIYHAHIFGPPGRRVQVIMLDTRSFRSPLLRRPVPIPGKGRYQPDATPGKTVLGARQWTWLEGELRKPAELRLIVSSIQVLAETHNFERWGNLPLERAKFFNLIRTTRANRVILLSGDRHRAAIYRNHDALAYPLYEITSSSLNRSFNDPTETAPDQIEPMFGSNNYGMLAINWAANTVAVTVRDEAGKIVRGQSISMSEIENPRN